MGTVIDFVLASAPKVTNLIGKLIDWMFRGIGNFGWTVVVFTVILKLILSPLDIWQRRSMRKNNRAMKIIAPELEKLKKTYANAPDVLQQKQMELYKKNGYSMLGGCLPALLTLVIFFVVFSGFNAAVKFENEKLVYDLSVKYESVLEENPTIAPEELDAIMVTSYNAEKQSWLWVKNVFMSDTYANPVPTREKFIGSGIGNLSAKVPDKTKQLNLARSNYDNPYDAVLKPAMESYNKDKFFDFAHWNGYFVLPVLSIALSVISVKISKKNQPQMPTQTDANGNPVKTGEGMMKAMNWIMPIMIGVFSLFYSAAFCIYMFVNSLITVLFNIVAGAVGKRLDAKAEDARLASTFKR